MKAWDNTRYCCASVLNIADNYLHITQDMFIRQGRCQTRGLMDFCYTAWPNTNTIQRKTNTIQTQHKYTILDFCKAAVPGADPPRLGQWARQGRQSASEGKLWKSGTDAAARSNLLPVTFCPPVVLGSSVVVFSRITGRNARERGVREGRGRSQQREARCAFLILLLLKTMCTAASVTSSSVWPNTWSKVEARSEKGKQSKWVWSQWEASSWLGVDTFPSCSRQSDSAAVSKTHSFSPPRPSQPRSTTRVSLGVNPRNFQSHRLCFAVLVTQHPILPPNPDCISAVPSRRGYKCHRASSVTADILADQRGTKEYERGCWTYHCQFSDTVRHCLTVKSVRRGQSERNKGERNRHDPTKWYLRVEKEEHCPLFSEWRSLRLPACVINPPSKYLEKVDEGMACQISRTKSKK